MTKTLDAHVHAWFSDRPSRPWDKAYRRANASRSPYLQHAGQTNSPDMILGEMREAGVDGTLLTSFGVYGANLEVEAEAVAHHPDRFRFVAAIDPSLPDIGEHLAVLRSRGLVGVRISDMRTVESVESGLMDPVIAACEDLGLLVMLPVANAALPVVFRRYAGTFFYLSHSGLGVVPPLSGYPASRPFEKLPDVLTLAEHPNVGIKLTGAAALSMEEYPFRDIQGPILQMVDAYGADRISWGSDYTRTAGLHSYHEATQYLREIPNLSSEQLELLYGETLSFRAKWT